MMKKYCPIALSLLSILSTAAWAEPTDTESRLNTLEAQQVSTRHSATVPERETRLAQHAGSEYEESWSALWE